MQESHKNQRNENMKGKLNETNQYEHHTGQLPMQLVNPKKLFSIGNSMPFFR